MIKQIRQQSVYIVDIASQVGCSERTVRRLLKFPEQPSRKTRHKMGRLKPFMNYIDMRLAENVCNSGVILNEIKAQGHTGGRSMLRYYIQPKLSGRLHLQPVDIGDKPVKFVGSEVPGSVIRTWPAEAAFSYAQQRVTSDVKC